MSIQIEQYTDRSFVVRGQTTPIKEGLKRLGGKWNSRLTDKKTSEKFGAWIFPVSKIKEVEAWIDNPIEVDSKRNDSCDTNVLRHIKNLENNIKNLEVMLKMILKKLNIEEEEEEEEEVVPRRRLLR